MPNYGDKGYWNVRYESDPDERFDWLLNYQTMKPVLASLIDRQHNILQLGCGNAALSEEMYDDGYHNITNMDFSPICINQMSERNQSRRLMSWDIMDATAMSYSDESFDVVIDKSTLDAVLCGNDFMLMAAKMLMEVQRVLRTGGIYIAISYGKPRDREFHLVVSL